MAATARRSVEKPSNYQQPDPTIIWDAQPRQAAFISCPIDDVGFGGARGGGKSDAVIGDWVSHEFDYGQHAIGMAFRRERTQLVELIERARQVLLPLGYKWHEADKYFRGPKGGRLRFTYLERDSDADAYQGHSYTRLYPEEMGTFPSEAPINKLQATLRSGNGVPCQMKGTCNPGGPGHQWVKARYRLDTHPQGLEVFRFEYVNPFTKGKIEKTRVFIPSKVSDNKFLGDDYVANLFQVGSQNLVRAWLEGDWSVIEGAFFDAWSLRNIVRPFEVPKEWIRIRSMDWGFAKPFSVGWWAVAAENLSFDTYTIPRGCMVRYREWYGAASANVGLRLDAEDVAKGIKEREQGEKIDSAVLDPAAFAQNGGPSLAERMATSHGVRFRSADNTRVGPRGAISGWDAMRMRIEGDDDGPMLVVFSTCVDTIRTVPVLQHDPLRAEDLDCWVADTLIATPQGAVPIQKIRIGDIVDTPIGPQPVLKSYLSGAGRTIRVALSDGRVIEGTPRHKVYVQGKGLVRLDGLECHDMLMERSISPCQRKWLFIAAFLTRATKGGFTTIRMARFWPLAGQACIGRFGSMLAGKFQMAGTSIISMATTTTTNSLTSNAYQPRSMAGITCESGWAQNWGPSLPHGGQVTTASERCEAMPAKCWIERQKGGLRAEIVASLLRRDILARRLAPLGVRPRSLLGKFIRNARFAVSAFGLVSIKRAKSKHAHIVAVGHSEGETKVYNLTVAKAHLFYANGVLSSNTDGEDHAADEIRYACLSRPWIRPVKIKEPGKSIHEMTLNDLWKHHRAPTRRIA